MMFLATIPTQIAEPVSTLTEGIVAYGPAVNDAGWLQRLFFRANAIWGPAAQTDFLFMAIWWFSAFWFVLLIGLSLFWTIKYRRRPGVPAQPSPSHNTKLEIAWTVIPSLFLIYLFFAGLEPYLDKLIAPPESLRYTVQAQKWSWSVQYPNGKKPTETVRINTKDIPVIYVPADRPSMFRLSSSDVIHSWWIPDFRSKIDVVPNRYTSLWIEPEALSAKDHVHPEGYLYREHWVFCAEYCGDDHSEMAALLRVVPYDVWLTKIEGTLEGEPWEIGLQIAQSNGCFGCHTTDGKPNTGPSWLNNYGYPREFSNASPLTQEILDTDAVAMDNYIHESILVPSAKIRAGFINAMTSYAGVLNDEEINAIIAYFKHLSDRGGSFEGSADTEPSDTPTDSQAETTPSPDENP